MANPADDSFDADVKKCGHLRKSKSLHRRYFVLRAASERGAARLEYYESEKKFRGRSAGPKRAVHLQSCFNINKRADSRNKYLVALYTRDECFSVAADSEQEQESWYQAIVELLTRSKAHVENGDSNYTMVPGPAFKEVWQVNLRPRGLGQSRNMSGIYRLCLTEKTINLVKLNSDAAAVVLQLMNIRRCGHSDNFFFVEVGRSAVTGPGEFWMQVDDSVVAQNMHETILEAMKAMSEEFRLRSKSQSSSSNPISVPSRRHHLANPPPSQVGFPVAGRRPGNAGGTTSPGQRYSFARPRTSSDGSGGPHPRPSSAEEVPSSPSPGAGPPRRGFKPHPPLGQTRSTPDPSGPRRSPSAPSPASLSSSGHGSECACPPASSSSGSPGGFASSSSCSSCSSCSSDGGEYGSSPDPAGFPPPSLEEEEQQRLRRHRADYTAMGRPASAGPEAQQRHRRLLRRASSRGTEEEAGRSLSKRASLPPAQLGKAGPPRSAKGQGHAAMSRAGSRELGPTTPDPDDGGRKEEPAADNGYMSMQPGVGSDQGRAGDYMSMTPKDASAPQQITNPRPAGRGGYMLMSPSGSCSPDSLAYPRSWAQAGNPKSPSAGSSDYMNMSPASRSASSTPPENRLHPAHQEEEEEEEAHSRHCYYHHSLPRSYKQPAGRLDESRLSASASSSGQLSCCSSTSSDSLGDAESGQPLRGPPRPGRGPPRLPGLHLEAAKASTLPRVRENPLPPEPKSPGEYVSIEFRGEPRGPGPLPRPASYAGGFRRLLPASEYVNMDLGPAARFSGYSQAPVAAPASPEVARLPLPEIGAIASKPGPHPDRGARVIRADPQGRRRHCSETFLPAPPAPSVAADRAKRRGSASFETAWPRDGGGGGAAEEPCPGMSRHMSIGFENGLNYIDLDLGTDSGYAEGSVPQPRLYSQANGSAGLNTYASIDFHKSEELRSHKSNKEDC
ncbi:insulin receptor substrate 1-B-like [Heptranchias perlo]|uniref:insulin receptor substrate 1-B-like n=1 Tax=Heptranchias perlo TaxID=212740 RepID=UPI00355A541D